MDVPDYPNGIYRIFTRIVDELAPKHLGLIKPLPGTDVIRGMAGSFTPLDFEEGIFEGAISASLPLSASALGYGNLQNNVVGCSVMRSKRPHCWVFRAEIQRQADLSVGGVQCLV